MFHTVGERTFVKPLDKTKSSTHRRMIHMQLDVPLLVTVIALCIIGLVMVYSASYDASVLNDHPPAYIFFLQLAWMTLGIGAAIFTSWFDYHNWHKLAIPLLGVTLVLLIGVLLINEVVNNAVRTMFSGSIQPSELAKFTTVIYLSVWAYSKRDQLRDITFGLLPLGAIVGIIGGLILSQPDLSAFITVVLLGGVIFFLAGSDLKQMILLVILALIFGVLVLKVVLTGSHRMQEYLLGLEDLTNASYHVVRSIEAFVRGEWFGVGIGFSEAKVTGLPYPYTDSIFAVIGEELGVFGASILVCLYTFLLWRGIIIANRAPDQLGRLLASGLSIWIVVEAFVNMSVMLNILPFAGNALPFISKGGSNLVMTLASIGIILNISHLSTKTKEQEGSALSEVVNLRWRDGGRRVSGARRSASARRTTPQA